MRYFVFYYSFRQGPTSFGHGYVTAESKEFPTVKEIREIAMENYPSNTGFVDTGFNEFKNKKDYERFKILE